MEIMFVLGFFVMLLLTGVSMVGVLAALLVATLLMFAGGLLALMIKLLPWLILAVVIAWIWRAVRQSPQQRVRKRAQRRTNRLNRYRGY